MECRTLQTLLHESLERTLSSDEQAQLDAHMAECPACHADAVLLRSIVQAVEETSYVQPSGDFTLKVMDRLPASVGGLFGIPALVLRGAAAAVAVVATALGWIYQESLIRFVQQLPAAAASSTDTVTPYLEQITTRIYGSWMMIASYLPQVDMERLSPVVSVLIAIGVAHVIVKMAYGFETVELDEVVN